MKNNTLKISGFTYVRNGLRYGYPFIASIQSLLPLVDELIIVVGDSTDNTLSEINSLNSEKIKIVHSTWDEKKRSGGEIFREQANIGIRHCTGDWIINLQADEVFHESAKEEVLKCLNLANQENNIEGILFPFLHFWGDYQHVRKTRRTHRYEIRAFKNGRNILSYKDSQGFRKYNTQSPDEKGTKLVVIKSQTYVYHYSYTRNPNLMKKKSNYFHSFWHDDQWLDKHLNEKKFDFNEVDKLETFTGDHPKYMRKVIHAKDWNFSYNPSKSNMTTKDKLLNHLEKLTGHRFFEYKNYKLKN